MELGRERRKRHRELEMRRKREANKTKGGHSQNSRAIRRNGRLGLKEGEAPELGQ